MITGKVNSVLEAVIRLTVMGPKGDAETIEGVIDTGFSGELTLPPSAIKSLELEWLGRESAQLADGSVSLLDVYAASVKWGESLREIELQSADTQPLIGMSLLQGCSLTIDVIADGSVSVDQLA